MRDEAIQVKERLCLRHQDLQAQLAKPPPGQLRFEGGGARLEGWKAANPTEDGRLDAAPSPDGRGSLHIQSGERTAAAWKTQVQLEAGKYRFEGRCRVSGVEALASGAHQGAGLRVGGSVRAGTELMGDSPWTTLSADFTVAKASEVELLCELRASAGQAWFDVDSLRVVRLP